MMSNVEGHIQDGNIEPQNVAIDVEMSTDAIVEGTGTSLENEEAAMPFATEYEEPAGTRVTFIDYLKSPIVEIFVGHGDDVTLLTAHQALLTQSPFFQDACAQFSENTAVSFVLLDAIIVC